MARRHADAVNHCIQVLNTLQLSTSFTVLAASALLTTEAVQDRPALLPNAWDGVRHND
jgi:hypothetical protein